jgi:putative MATE family efflux protein
VNRASQQDSATRRVLSGPLSWEVLRFGAPLALGMALQTAFNLVDAYLIAQLAPGERQSAVGALGTCDQLAALGTIVSYGLTTATATRVSNQKGAGDHEGVKRTVWQSLYVLLLLSVIFGLMGAFSETIVRAMMGLKGAVADVATRYLRVMMSGSFSIFFLLHFTSIQRALGSAKTPVALLALGNLLNLFFAVVCLFGPEPARQWDVRGAPVSETLAWGATVARALSVPTLGMVGAAWATIAARALVLIPMVFVLVIRFDVFPGREHRRLDGGEIRKILALAWPSSVQFVLRIMAALLVHSLVARFFTSEADQTASTAMGLVFRIDTMAMFVAMGWGSGAQTFVGQNLGAGNPARAKRAGWYAAGYDVITNLVLWAALAYFARDVLMFFGKDRAAVDIGVHYIQIVAPSYVALGLGIVLGNAIAAAGAVRTTLALDLFVLGLIQLPLSLGAVLFLTPKLTTLFTCVSITALCSAIAYGAVYARGKWRMSKH